MFFSKTGGVSENTPPIAEILCVKNVPLKLGWLDWLCYLAGNSQKAPMISFMFSAYLFYIISLRTHKPQMPSHFDT